MKDIIVTIANRLDSQHIMEYAVIVGLFGACWYLLKINQKMGEQNHENSILLAKISEQLSTLVQAAFSRRRD